MEPSTIAFQKWRRSHGADFLFFLVFFFFCSLNKTDDFSAPLSRQTLRRSTDIPGHQIRSSHKSPCSTLTGWRENNAAGWFLSSAALLLISANNLPPTHPNKKAAARWANSNTVNEKNVMGQRTWPCVPLHLSRLSHEDAHLMCN